MTIDLARTLSLVKGGLLDHQATWNTYLGENRDWQYTATVLTGPLLIANVVLSILLSRMTGGFAYMGYHDSLLANLFWGFLTAVLGLVISVFVFNFLAGTFKGNSNFSRAFAAVSLAAIPSWIAGILGSLIPYIGFLIILAGFIMSLYLMYKIMPLALGVPDEKRLVHFILSLVAIVVLNMIVGAVIGLNTVANNLQRGEYSEKQTSATGSGVLGDYERQGRLMEAAGDDTFDPPGDGELSESQVKAYVKVLKKTRAIHAEYAQQMEDFSKEMDAKKKAGETPSASDMSKIFGGITKTMSANNAEMEVVKTGGGNWAEHQWVKEQLRIAKIQMGDGSDAIEHNYKLLQEYKEELE